MKRFMFVLVLFLIAPIYAWWGEENYGEIGPGIATSANVSIPAPGADKQNCLTMLSVSNSVYGANTSTLRILDGLINGATIYQIVLSTTSGISSVHPFSLPLDINDPFCVSSNNGILITNTATTYNVNYQGYIRKTR